MSTTSSEGASLPEASKRRLRKETPKPTTDTAAAFFDLAKYPNVSAELRFRETRVELQSRLKIEEEKSAHERRKEILILWFVLIGLSTIAMSCLFVTLRSGPSEDRKWAMSTLAAIVAGGLGYLGGKSGKTG